MTAQIINGKAIAETTLTETKSLIDKRLAKGLRAPTLAVILLGADPASAIYVRNKRLACEKTGIRSLAYDLPASTSEAELLALIDKLNHDDEVDGILVQSPFPAHIEEKKIIETISASKDVDGFHAYNIGRLAVRQPTLRSCTPYGVIKLLQSTGIKLLGLDAVVVGVSNHVGRPMALELLLAGCTVTSCHRHTKSLQSHIERADIVVAAAGKPHLVKGEWIKPGAVVIDIGINRLADGSLCGDVEFATAKERAGWITPVPGGVGPMTVATLMQNTLTALELRESSLIPA
ncbi:bifunctional methylenetetrahydrofolate dehydrogenase/methenyltetrahydrofolate cyclohydrolase FolD [Methylobacillus arboreus]|uniref:bifunctional methylenetetrahydrofolate dehydrogenase/methenyltetrahydrofolate cyclohydrolase FolD n=1 Tax=Methylobacillus arboreus TaxID=755170 RepID=UPI001E45EE32|nr:bifunctional methylenetetrahydrofolate dehydrogenase/methenyltetrahydrofolate cyclohydrolase FolD [Methylobacillus arboreus]MCB5190073.1 bifunctional methylenetetrahydrofolate dehydrogenase/methenyltetrahydrofolate cyclohydrolase FolD [Methylobacillus arboreus]